MILGVAFSVALYDMQSQDKAESHGRQLYGSEEANWHSNQHRIGEGGAGGRRSSKTARHQKIQQNVRRETSAGLLVIASHTGTTQHSRSEAQNPKTDSLYYIELLYRSE